MRWFAAALSVMAMLMPVAASAHPHIWISQHVRVIVAAALCVSRACLVT